MTSSRVVQTLTLGLVCGLWLPTCHKKPAPVPPPTVGAEAEVVVQDTARHLGIAQVEMRELHARLLAAGRVAYNDANVAHVMSPVTGRVLGIHAQLGEQVHQGARLATIESPDIGMASADVDKAHAVVFATEADFKRKQALFHAGAVAQRDLEVALDSYEVALAELRRAESKYSQLGGGAYEPNHVRGTYHLVAPIAGEVVNRAIGPGMEIIGQYQNGTGSELFTVANLNDVWVVADVYESDVGRVKPGMPVSLSVASYPHHVFNGTIDWVSDVLDPTAKTARLRCNIKNTDGLLKPDMFVSVAIASHGSMVLTVPRQSVTRLGEKTVVYLQTGQSGAGDRRFVRRPVIVDEAEEGDHLPVLYGLNAGDNVVTQGVEYLVGKN